MRRHQAPDERVAYSHRKRFDLLSALAGNLALERSIEPAQSDAEGDRKYQADNEHHNACDGEKDSDCYRHRPFSLWREQAESVARHACANPDTRRGADPGRPDGGRDPAPRQTMFQ
jgi:hypothetical protein